MSIFDLVGKSIPKPIRGNYSFGRREDLWHKPHVLRDKAQRVDARDGSGGLTYTLLYYVAGMVTVAGLHTQPVLTGHMSGCWLFRYRSHGHLRVAHVGTDSFDQDLNVNAKAVWRSYVGRPHVHEVRGFEPVSAMSPALQQQAESYGTAVQHIGAWEPNGHCYTGAIVTDPEYIHNVIVVGFERVRTRPWRDIQALPTFAMG